MEIQDLPLERSELELDAEPMQINVGPAHPAMHGTVRCVMELSGEHELLQVIEALGSSGCFARRLHGGEQQSYEDTNDGDDDEQLDQREAVRFTVHDKIPSSADGRSGDG